MFNSPSQMEPLLIEESRPRFMELLGLAHGLDTQSAVLHAKIAPKTAQSMSELVLGMNCYYSNLIEGHQTLPDDIARALEKYQRVDAKPDLKNLSAAHIQAETWARKHNLLDVGIIPFISSVHRIFIEHMPPEQRVLKNGRVLEPGALRTNKEDEVLIGLHHAPDPLSVAQFLDRYDSVYTRLCVSALARPEYRLKAIASCFIAHHRFVWIHPFMDGNGRTARILLDAMLRACGVNTSGLWSMSRGFSKTLENYKATLAGADQPRMGDYDGRGNLSEQKLMDFCAYSIHTACDQARYMYGLFDVHTMESRINVYFRSVRTDLKPESSYLYTHAILHGEFDRMQASRITGLPERTARDVLAVMVSERLLVSDTPKGRIRAGFPMHTLDYLFPNLYPFGSTSANTDALEPSNRARSVIRRKRG